METRGVDVRTAAREDERRRRDEAQFTALQQQLDELRHMVREQLGRTQRAEEQVRQSESQLGGVRAEMDEVRQELNRFMQVRLLEEQRLREQVADVQSRAEEPLRPLRALQAQVADLLEFARHQRDQASREERQIVEVRAHVDSFRADIIRALEIARLAKETVDGFSQAQATLARDIVKVNDQGRLIEQEARRGIADLTQQLNEIVTRLDEVAGYRPMLEASIRQLDDEIAAFQPRFDALMQRDEQQTQQLSRVRLAAEERDNAMRERLEEIRTQLASEIATITVAGGEAAEGLHERIADWEEAHKDFVARLTELAVQFNALKQRDERLLEIIRRTEERLVRVHLEQAQAAWEALMERRQKENER